MNAIKVTKTLDAIRATLTATETVLGAIESDDIRDRININTVDTIAALCSETLSDDDSSELRTVIQMSETPEAGQDTQDSSRQPETQSA